MAECLSAYLCPAEWLCLHQQRLGNYWHQNQWDKHFVSACEGHSAVTLCCSWKEGSAKVGPWSQEGVIYPNGEMMEDYLPLMLRKRRTVTNCWKLLQHWKQKSQRVALSQCWITSLYNFHRRRRAGTVKDNLLSQEGWDQWPPRWNAFTPRRRPDNSGVWEEDIRSSIYVFKKIHLLKVSDLFYNIHTIFE